MLKSNGSIFTKPCELTMMTHEKNEVSLATQIFRIVARVDFLRNSVAAEFLSVTVDFFITSRLLYVKSLIINFAEMIF